MRRTALLLVVAATFVGCNDSPSGPACPNGPTITETGAFDLAVDRGEQSEWTHSVALPVGSTWVSAEIVFCAEVGRARCSSTSLRLEEGVMTFSGVVTNEYTSLIRVEWEAKGC